MSSNVWNDLHQHYKKQDWIDKPNIFATEVLKYIPNGAKVLELGAGQGQDTRFFAEEGIDITSTDISSSALKDNKKKLPSKLAHKVSIKQVDISKPLDFEDKSFDAVYAHLSIHYFDAATTRKILQEIHRVLKPNGLLLMLNNAVTDPEYGQGEEIEEDYFYIEDKKKRYFSTDKLKWFLDGFDTVLLDDMGETYKDAAKGIHNLIRYVGKKIPVKNSFRTAIPFVGGIIEREKDGNLQILMQTRWKPNRDPVYSGTLEFPAGVLDKPYEPVFETLAREIKEETNLELESIIDDSRTNEYKPQGSDASIGFRPFCCVQQLKDGKPWIGFIFRCRVSEGDPIAQKEEVKDIKWMDVSEIQKIFEESPEKLFTLEIAAWEYYFNEIVNK